MKVSRVKRLVGFIICCPPPPRADQHGAFKRDKKNEASRKLQSENISENADTSGGRWADVYDAGPTSTLGVGAVLLFATFADAEDDEH